MIINNPINEKKEIDKTINKNNINKLLNDTIDIEKHLSKSQRRRLKKRLAKKKNKNKQNLNVNTIKNEIIEKNKNDLNVEVEYIGTDILSFVTKDDPNFNDFSRIFNKFAKPEELCNNQQEANNDNNAATDTEMEIDNDMDDDENDNNDNNKENITLSRKQRKKLKRLSVAELKQLVTRPDVVEAHDVTSADPRFLVYLKSYRNTVSVPRHWCHKRKYLQGKRGIEKKPFSLPEYIQTTGITEARNLLEEEENNKKLKTKAREKKKPKINKVDIDYQVLHDAFFKYQTKNKDSLTILGDLYYEGKEFEVKLKSKSPGILSEELKRALGMSDGMAPPWLLNMQRYGPPPAYPKLKIPGLNAPIPPGASFGYHPGGWGKPPVDQDGKPLYGDVFAKPATDTIDDENNTIIDKEKWGELQEVEEEVEEESDEELMEENTETDTTIDANEIASDGFSSVTSGLTTPSSVDLRKYSRGIETPSDAGTPAPTQAYSVLIQKETIIGDGLYGSSHTYIVPENPSNHETNAENNIKSENMIASSSSISISSNSNELTDQKTKKRKINKIDKKENDHEDDKETKNKKYKDFKF